MGTAWGQSCSVTTTPAGFGNYDTSASAPLDTVAEVIVNCESGVPYQIRLDAGQNAGGGFDRNMRSSAGDATLAYNLFRDLARTEIWGDGSGSTVTRTGTGTGGPEPVNVYGRIPGRQNVTVGVYSDSVIVTVEW